MESMRVFYAKTGTAKYISHLDINRCFQRAMKRAAIPLWFTEGFNPHAYLTFPLPLALGYESLCECVDFRLVEPIEPGEIVRRLNAVLPMGLKAVRAAPPAYKAADIALAAYGPGQTDSGRIFRAAADFGHEAHQKGREGNFLKRASA